MYRIVMNCNELYRYMYSMMGWDKGSVTNNCDPTKLKDAIIVDKAVEETMTLALVTVSHCARRNSRSDRFESTPKIRQHFVFNLFKLFFLRNP